jgi:hypothetical protein
MSEWDLIKVSELVYDNDLQYRFVHIPCAEKSLRYIVWRYNADGKGTGIVFRYNKLDHATSFNKDIAYWACRDCHDRPPEHYVTIMYILNEIIV